MAKEIRIVALAGGVGAARFLRGLVKVCDPSKITIIGNTVFFFRNCIIATLLNSLNREIIVAIDHQQ